MRAPSLPWLARPARIGHSGEVRRAGPLGRALRRRIDRECFLPALSCNDDNHVDVALVDVYDERFMRPFSHDTATSTLLQVDDDELAGAAGPVGRRDAIALRMCRGAWRVARRPRARRTRDMPGSAQPRRATNAIPAYCPRTLLCSTVSCERAAAIRRPKPSGFNVCWYLPLCRREHGSLTEVAVAQGRVPTESATGAYIRLSVQVRCRRSRPRTIDDVRPAWRALARMNLCPHICSVPRCLFIARKVERRRAASALSLGRDYLDAKGTGGCGSAVLRRCDDEQVRTRLRAGRNRRRAARSRRLPPSAR